jgi:flagellar basal body-associated protein FliL
MIVIITLLLLLLVAVGTLGVFAITKLGKLGDEAPVPTPIVVDEITPDKQVAIPIAKKVTNLLPGEDGKSHVISIEISVVIDNSKPESEDFVTLASDRTDIFDDALLYVCRNTTYEQLREANGWDVFKKNLIDVFRDGFKSDLIYKVNIISNTLQ